jgi:hypothetical protein
VRLCLYAWECSKHVENGCAGAYMPGSAPNTLKTGAPVLVCLGGVLNTLKTGAPVLVCLGGVLNTLKTGVGVYLTGKLL